MPGVQVAPLLRSSRRKPPLGRPDPGGPPSSGWFCKFMLLGLLAVLALLTSFQNLRVLSGGISSSHRKLQFQKSNKDAFDTINQKGLSENKDLDTINPKGLSKKAEELSSAYSNQKGLSRKEDVSAKLKKSESCRGIEHWELWGPAILAGDRNKQPSAKKCCASCTSKCLTAATCICDSWVYCGDQEACNDHFQECWLKKQADELKPEVRMDSTKSPWTSGLIYPAGTGIVSLETAHGKIRIQLAPHLAPRTVDYVRKVLGLKFCSGCQFYRAEGTGNGWTPQGRRTKAPPGPPYALLQGSLQADGFPFEEILKEGAEIATRGTVCLIGGGPEFFISVGDHEEWDTAHTVFGHVLPEDMTVVDALVELPTRRDVWGQTEVQVLESPVQFALKRAGDIR